MERPKSRASLPGLTAMSYGVAPMTFCSVMSAPCSRQIMTQSVLFCAVAMCKGVFAGQGMGGRCVRGGERRLFVCSLLVSLVSHLVCACAH